ncbi:MAG: hypothetical protein LBU27_01615 [Candidatus Peribacteria bacterium]|nr:hypothetical protein [Candidatus Peribacteria bacterium]
MATSFPSIEINETFPIFNKTRETEITLAGEITETTSTETPKQYNKTYNGLPLFTASDLQRPYRSKNI